MQVEYSEFTTKKGLRAFKATFPKIGCWLGGSPQRQFESLDAARAWAEPLLAAELKRLENLKAAAPAREAVAANRRAARDRRRDKPSAPINPALEAAIESAGGVIYLSSRGFDLGSLRLTANGELTGFNHGVEDYLKIKTERSQNA